MLRLVAICLHTVYDNQELVTDVLLESCQKLDDSNILIKCEVDSEE